MKRLLLLVPTLLLVVTFLFPTPSVAARIAEGSGHAAIATYPATATTVPATATAIPAAPAPQTPVRDTTIPKPVVDTSYPLPADAALMTNPYDDTVIFTTNLSLSEVVDFYRVALAANGGVERNYLTFVEEADGWFSVVFDDWANANGQSVVIQGVEFPEGTSTVSIRLEAVN